MNSSMPNDGRLHTRAILAPEVNTFDGTAFEGLASDEGLRVPDERSLKII
jgi:hypothetical protein